MKSSLKRLTLKSVRRCSSCNLDMSVWVCSLSSLRNQKDKSLIFFFKRDSQVM